MTFFFSSFYLTFHSFTLICENIYFVKVLECMDKVQWYSAIVCGLFPPHFRRMTGVFRIILTSAAKTYNFPTHKGFCHHFPTKARYYHTHTKMQQ